MEDAGRQTGIDLRMLEQFQEMFHVSGTSGCNDGNVDSRSNCLQHFNIKTALHTVGIDAIDHDFTGTVGDALLNPFQGIEAGIDSSAVLEDMEASVDPLGIDREHHTLTAVFLCRIGNGAAFG